LRVCILTPAFPAPRRPYHGIFVKQDAKALVEEGIQVTVIAPRFRGDPSEKTHDGIRILRFHWWAPRRFKPIVQLRRRDAWRLPSLLYGMYVLGSREAKTSDVILAYWILPSGFVGTLIKLRRKRRLIVYAMGTDIHILPKHPIYGLLVRYTTKRADMVLLNLPGMQQYVSRYRLQGRFKVLPAAINPELFRPAESPLREQKPLSNRFIILFVGNLIPEKGVLDLIEVFRQFRERHENAVLLIAGRGPLAGKVRKEESVVYVGPVEHNLIPDYLNAADVVVIPSHAEGPSNVILLEALACARPVIATDIHLRFLPHDVLEGSVLLVPEKDPKALLNALEQLYSNPDLRTRLASCARERILMFNASTRKQQLLSVLENVFDSSGR